MKELPKRLCSKNFGQKEVSIIQEEVQKANPMLRSEIARRVCKRLGWVDSVGRAKLMSARKALLRLHREEHIVLPPPKNGNGNQKKISHDGVNWPERKPLSGSVEQLNDLKLRIVANKTDSRIFNALVDKYHYLGYRPLPGAQVRYLIQNEKSIIGAISFSGAAWKVAARDSWIGWDSAIREKNLTGIINNTRFLILPWIEIKNLASKILSLSIKRLKVDMLERYGYAPVLLETFVDSSRFHGTCYRAANWINVGHTKGRGRGDQYHNKKIPVKDIFLFPLRKDFRRFLGGLDEA